MRQDNLDIAEWIRYAKGDYDAARKMAEQFQPVPLEIVCYHCQQSAEKILKAYILANGDELIKTHDIYTLLERCKSFNPDFEKLVKIGTDLSDYVALSRYPAFD
ncbi:MAG: HEPN domain-containing protein, partial [Candidatus Margulisbacteria bacterium]|nr:HEPN domain-containing protein [Candidatus Margulisiibacteriota bacterium]